MRLRSDFRAAVSLKKLPDRESGEQVKNNTGNVIPLQAHRGGTSMELEISSLEFLSDLLFVTVGFVYSR